MTNTHGLFGPIGAPIKDNRPIRNGSCENLFVFSPIIYTGRVELARLLINGGKSHWPEAEYWLREAAERNPEKEPCRVELARLLIRIGEQYWPEAEEWLRAVIALHPENGHSHNELARLLTRTGRRSLGIALLEQFQRRYPGNAAVTSNLEQLVNGIAISATEDAHEDHAAVSPSGASTGAVAPKEKSSLTSLGAVGASAGLHGSPSGH